MKAVLDEDQLGTFIDAHYRSRGDVLFRMERHPVYAVPQQSAELEAWRNGGKLDLAAKQPWLDVLAGEVARGMLTRRVRILSAELTDDEQRACHWGYPYVGRFEEIRVLHRGEHVLPDVLDHDYWIVRPADADVQIVRMDYLPGGQFRAAVVLPASEHRTYLHEERSTWAAGEPFGTWWVRHSELHRGRTAA